MQYPNNASSYFENAVSHINAASQFSNSNSQPTIERQVTDVRRLSFRRLIWRCRKLVLIDLFVLHLGPRTRLSQTNG